MSALIDSALPRPARRHGAGLEPRGIRGRLRDKGAGYHIRHPFNVMLNTGKASREQVRGWVANRFYYQIAIPVKDAAVLSNCPDREVRRAWVQRILDHDGFELATSRRGGIEAWLRLAERRGLRARRCSTCATCCRRCASRSTPT
jgi:pyrroloquinoline-quinone synthase